MILDFAISIPFEAKSRLFTTFITSILSEHQIMYFIFRLLLSLLFSPILSLFLSFFFFFSLPQHFFSLILSLSLGCLSGFISTRNRRCK